MVAAAVEGDVDRVSKWFHLTLSVAGRRGHGRGDPNATEPVVKAVKDGIIARRGQNTRNIAKVAAARKVHEIVYYVLRDGQARCLTAATDAA